MTLNLLKEKNFEEHNRSNLKEYVELQFVFSKHKLSRRNSFCLAVGSLFNFDGGADPSKILVGRSPMCTQEPKIKFDPGKSMHLSAATDQ